MKAYANERELIEDCAALWPELQKKIQAALDDTHVPSTSEASDLAEFKSAAYAVADSNPARVAAVVIENALRALYLYATGRESIPVDPNETDVFDPDFEIDLMHDKVNKAVIAYRVLFVEKPDQRFLTIAAAHSCYSAQRAALVSYLSAREITSSAQVDGSWLAKWFEALKPSDTLFEKLRNAALEEVAPPFLFLFGEHATKVVADYASDVSTELVNKAKSRMSCARCVLEAVDYEVNQLCSINFIKTFVCFECRPKAALLGIREHRDNAKERHPPLIVYMNDGTLYMIHKDMFEHHDIYAGLTRWMDLMHQRPILGTKFVDAFWEPR